MNSGMDPVKVENHNTFLDDDATIDTDAAEAAIRAQFSRKRTKTGCLTCRKRRIKCDEGKPICNNCHKSRRQCEGYNQRIVFKPADYQYLPHGAASITWHSGLVPNEMEGIAQAETQTHFYSQLRPRYIAPQQQYIDHAEIQQHQSAIQQRHLGSYPLDQAGLDIHALQQVQHLLGSSLPYHPAQNHYQVPLTPENSVHDTALQQYFDPIISDPGQARSQITPEEHQQATTLGWPQVLTQSQLDQNDNCWQHKFSDSSQRLQEQPQRRIKISQTTTVEHEWPAQTYIPRPELSQPIDDHNFTLTPRFQATQFYNQDTESEPVRNDSMNVFQTPKLETSSNQSVSPTRMLDEAAIEVQDDDYYDIDSHDDMDQVVSSVYTLEKDRQAFLNAVASKGGFDACVLDTRRYDTFVFPGMLDSYRPERVANPLKNSATARVFAHFISATGPLLTSFARQARTSHSFLRNEPVPLSQQGVWTYSMPMAALHHQGLLQAILAISSLHIAKLQRASETPSMKHYAYALKRIHHCVGHRSKRLSAPMLAATLLLGYYEIIAANHTSWNSHLAGAKQLIIETDFSGMTREFRKMKLDKAARDQQNSVNVYNLPIGFPNLTHNGHSDDFLLEQIPDVDENIVSSLAGRCLRYERFGHVEEGKGSKCRSKANMKPLDLPNFEVYKDLFWWYCKQDVIQSIISGNALLMDYDRYTDCPPRAPLNNPDAIYGTVDHLILLLGRIADFASRDRERKLRVMENNGGFQKPSECMRGGGPPGPLPTPGCALVSGPTPQTKTRAPPQIPFFGMAPAPVGGVNMPASYQPTQESPTPSTAQSRVHDPIDLRTATDNAVKEWDQILAALKLLAEQLGIHFQPLGPEYQQPIETPFGTAMVYRSWDISCFWAIYYMSMIVLHRSHPHMPPAAHMAAGVAVARTRDAATKIGQIAAGVIMPPPERALNPKLGAAMCDLSVPLFFSGIQYSDAAQRKWLVQRLFQVDRRTGWATAALIAEGVQTSWVKAAAAGRGPPYERVSRANFHDDRVGMYLDSNYQVVNFQGQPEPVQETAHSRRFVHTKAAARLHWAIGIIGGEDDLGLGPT